MTDTRAGDTPPFDNDDRLPWLEAVEEDEDHGGPSPLKLLVAVILGLIAIGIVVGGLFWIGNRDNVAGTGGPELITAENGPYKIKPEEPGGMKVEGEGDTSFAASEGAEPKGKIDTSAVPEAPVTQAAKTPAGAPKPKAETPKPAAPAPKPAPAATGATIQLGAFSSQSGAEKAWKALSGRFSYLAPLSHNVTTVQSGGKTLYRLRASGPDADGICGRLRVAGESCVTID